MSKIKEIAEAAAVFALTGLMLITGYIGVVALALLLNPFTYLVIFTVLLVKCAF